MRSSLVVRTLVVVTSLVVSGYGLAGSEPETQPLDVGHGEHTRVEIVQLPLIIESRDEKRPAACDELKADRLRVVEGGEEMQIIELDPSRLPTIHVILIDTSESMVAGKRLEGSLRAARSYLDRLLPDDQPISRLFEHDAVMLATFDDDLLLHAPLVFLERQGAKRQLEAAFASINSGIHTTLNDSIAYLTSYLRVYPHRSIVILLSDGADSGSFYDSETAKYFVNATNGLTVFAIGLSLDKHLHQTQRRYLRELAQVSGGTFENVWGLMKKSPEVVAKKLGKPFENIHRRLSREYFVSYRSKAFGKGLRDAVDAGNKNYVVRDVEVKSLDENCVVRGYKRSRYVTGAYSIEEFGRPDPPAGALPLDRGSPESLDVVLEVNDIVQDDGPLWIPSAVGTREFAQRTVIVGLPPLGTAAAAAVGRGAIPTEAEDVLHELLMRRGVPISRIVNGKTLLVYRERIARRIFDESADYRKWCRRRMAGDIERELRDRLPPTVTEDQFARILSSRLNEPRNEDLQRYLAAWRGDIHARDLALRLEKKEANDLLEADASDLGDTLERVETVQRRWEELTRWFKEPEEVRVLALLLLTYDPQQDLFGFFRVVLPRFDLHYRHRGRKSIREIKPSPLNPVPDRPLGLQLVRWILGLPVAPGHSVSPTGAGSAEERRSLAEELRARWRVESVAHEPVGVATDDADQEPATEKLETVLLHLAGAADGSSGARVTLKAIMSEGSEDPICLGLGAGSDAAALESRIEETGLEACGER